MENFKEIAEKCANGEIYGTIILDDGREFYSKYLSQYIFNEKIVDGFYTVGLAKYLFHVDQIIDFIPNNMQKKIEIDIPEGKVPVMEQTKKGVVITWKDKEVTYTEVYESLQKHGKVIHYIINPEENTIENLFIKKVNILRKLTNIRNYFGKPDENERGWSIEQEGIRKTMFESKYNRDFIIFAKKEHAEQAIKMLGDELKYLFEPW